jgi:hypothetical protein
MKSICIFRACGETHICHHAGDRLSRKLHWNGNCVNQTIKSIASINRNIHMRFCDFSELYQLWLEFPPISSINADSSQSWECLRHVVKMLLLHPSTTFLYTLQCSTLNAIAYEKFTNDILQNSFFRFHFMDSFWRLLFVVKYHSVGWQNHELRISFVVTLGLERDDCEAFNRRFSSLFHLYVFHYRWLSE